MAAPDSKTNIQDLIAAGIDEDAFSGRPLQNQFGVDIQGPRRLVARHKAADILRLIASVGLSIEESH